MTDLQAVLIAARVLGAVLHLALTVVCGWWFSIAKPDAAGVPTYQHVAAAVGAMVAFAASLLFWRAALEGSLWQGPWPPESPWRDDPNETTVELTVEELDKR